MKISVVMAVYNGEKYIRKQLTSILSQTRNADEVIISDDCSTDGSVEMIASFIEQNSLKGWTVLTSASNQGWIRNFYKGLNSVTGDIIFFADQDDIWENDKIQIMTEIMSQNRNMLALAGCITLIDGNDAKMKDSKLLPFYSHHTNQVRRNKFNSKIVYSIMPGCTLAFRKELIPYTQSTDVSFIPHDALFWKLATILDGAYYLDRVVIRYRIHNTNASGAATENIIGKTDIHQRIAGIEKNRKVIEQFLHITEHLETENKNYKQKIIKKSIDVLKLRDTLLKQKQIFCLPRLIANYRYYPYLSALAGDIAYLVKINAAAGALFEKIYKN